MFLIVIMMWRAHAIDLGIAMQLTNIARDVLEDAEMGRRYLPASWTGDVTPAHITVASHAPDSEVAGQSGRLNASFCYWLMNIIKVEPSVCHICHGVPICDCCSSDGLSSIGANCGDWIWLASGPASNQPSNKNNMQLAGMWINLAPVLATHAAQ